MTKTVTFGQGQERVTVPALGFGCMGLSWAYIDDAVTREDRAAVLREAVACGVKLFDTSDQYGPFTNEELIGEVLAPRRRDVFLASKGGLVVDQGAMRTTRDGSPAHLREALTGSLERLQTDHLDLYQLHRIDPKIPLEHSWEALAREVAEGRTRFIGLSDVSIAEIERAARIHPVASVQSELSLWNRGALNEVVPYCREQGIVFVAYAPLGRGFLADTITSARSLDPRDMRLTSVRFHDEAIQENTRRLLGPLRECAEQLGVTTAQVALAWVLMQGEGIAAIPGTKRSKYLIDNVGASSVVIPPECLERLNALPVAVDSADGVSG